MKIWRSKKLLVSGVLAAVLVAGSIGGAVAAADGEESQPETLFEALWDRVCAIYKDNTGDDIDPEALRDAVVEARAEMCAEAQDLYLQKLADEGRITPEQAEELKAWWDARPDDLPFLRPFGRIRSHGFGGGMKWGEESLFAGKMSRCQPVP